MWLDVFNDMRKQSKMSLDEISLKSGVPKGTLSKISAGITKAPPLETMRKLVYSMGYTLDDLDEGLDVSNHLNKSEKEHMQKYRRLDQNWKKAVDSVLDAGYQACTATASADDEPDNLIYITKYYPSSMSAGTGQPAGDDYDEELDLVKRPPRGTSYVASVSGDSMEPTFHDGDKLFIKACERIDPGQVGVFYMDGQQWVKELGEGVLISHNEEYEPIEFVDGIKCQGLVLGVCDESYLR